MQKQTFSLSNVHCSACEAKVTKLLMELKGVQEVSINILRKSMLVTFDNDVLGVASIVSTMQQAGYEATPTRFSHTHEEPVKTEKPDIASLLSPFPMSKVKEDKLSPKLQEQAFMLNKVHCASCQGKIHGQVMSLHGVQKATVDTLRKSVVITFDSNKTNIAVIEKNFAGTKYAMKAMEKSAFLPLIPHISNVKQKKIPKAKESNSLSSQEKPTKPSNADDNHKSADAHTADEKSSINTSTTAEKTMPLLASATTTTTLEQTSNTQLETEKKKIIKQDFNIGNVHCTACEAKVLTLLGDIDGIEKIAVNVLRKTMRVHFNDGKIQPADITKAMEQAGYSATPVEHIQAPMPFIPSSPLTPLSSPAQNGENAEPPHGGKKLQRQDFTIGNVHCTACEAKVIALLGAMDGIEKVAVNVLRQNMLVNFDSEKIQVADIIHAMESAGYKAKPYKGIMEYVKGQDTLHPPLKVENTKNIQEYKEITHGQATTPTPHHEEQTEEQQGEKQAENAFMQQEQPAATAPNFFKNIPLPLLFSLVFASILMYVAMAPMVHLPLPAFIDMSTAPLSWALAQAVLTLPILLFNYRIFITGLRGILQASPNMDSLVGLGSATAALFGLYALARIYMAQGTGDAATVQHFANNLYFDSAGMILALIGLGKFFESKARERTGSAIDALMRLTPPTATVLRNGEEVTISTAEIQKGDILIVHAGQSLAADGVITHGSGFIDTSAITGESLPQEKKEGDTVIGATICQSGYFHMQVTHAGEDSMLAKIIELVESATASKAPIARLADRISAIFVPVIIGIAIISFASWMLLGQSLEFALSTAISVLVISCPCALGLATPTAIMVGMGIGAEHGILFKSAAAIERMQDINTVVLDKTGTLTYGKPQVTDIIPVSATFTQTNTPNAINPEDARELLITAASLEKLSEHSLGQAIVNKATKENLTLLPTEALSNFIQMPGLGIQATYNGEQYLAGNARLLSKENIFNPLHEKEKELARLGKTVLYFVKGTQLLGFIAVADAVKESSREAVQNLKGLGLNVFMLTGDNAITAKAVQEQVDIENIFAEVLPQDKEEKIRELQNAGHKAIMVGDGINDAPALARAHVGIAVGQGTDIALQSSDIVLMQSDVAHVSGALKLSRAVMRTIKQNLFWAFAYNTVLIPVAAGLFYGLFGLSLNPMLAAASMSLSSLTVVGNALRLRSQAKNIFSS